MNIVIRSKMPFYFGEVFLHINRGDRENAERIVENFAKIHKLELSNVYENLLVFAACYGQIKVAEFCKDKGVDLDCEDERHRTPLWVAIQFGEKEMEQALRKWGARKDISRTSGVATPGPVLKFSTDYCLEAGYVYNHSQPWEKAFVYIKQGDRESAERVIKDFAKKNKLKLGEVYGNLLVSAAHYGEIEVAKFCKDKGVKLDYTSKNLKTPLWVAIQSGKKGMEQALREWGARGDTHFVLGKPILFTKEPTFNHVEASRMYGSLEGKMPLYYKEIFLYIKQGSRENAERIIGDLIEKNKWKLEDVYGYLLCVAACYGEIEVAEFCRSKGINLDYENHNGDTPLAYARLAGQKQMAETLREWGACKGTRGISSEIQSFSIQEAQEMDKKTCRLM